MSKTIAIDWDDTELRLVMANVHSGSLTLEDVARVDLPEGDARGPADLAAVIKKAMSDHRFRATDAVIAVPRSAVELRTLSVPQVPNNELPDIVRFQALREFSEVSDNWPIDFLVDKSTDEQIHVKAAALAPKKFADYKKVCEKAGLKCAGLMLRPTASAVIVAKHADRAKEVVSLVIDLSGRTAELTVLTGREVQLMREVRVTAEPGSDEQRELLLAEIRRTLSAARNQFHADVECVVILGSVTESRELVDLIKQQLQLLVDVINPLEVGAVGSRLSNSVVTSPGRYAAGIGMLSELVSRDRQTIDFVNPRRTVEPPSVTRRYIVPGAIAATIALLILGVVGWKLASIDARIAGLRLRLQESKPAIEKAQVRIAEVEAIEAWAKSDVNWLAEIERVSRRLPDARHIRMNRLQCRIMPNGNGEIEVEGISDSPASVKEMEQALAGEKRNVRGAHAQYDAKDPQYHWQFKETVSVDNDVPVIKPTRRGPARNNLLGSIGGGGQQR